MNFIGCDGAWVQSAGGLTCDGTLTSFTVEEMRQVLEVGAAASLPFAQLVEYGIYYGLTYWALFFVFGQIRRAIG